jgi:CRISPR-associated protein (TIGR02710 family)
MHAYAAAASVFQEECERRFQPEQKAKAQFFVELATAYAAWDRFEYDGACAAFEKLARTDIETAPWASQLKLNMQAVHMERKDCYALHRLADLFNNATRRAAQGAWDDAVARLYRAVEFGVQIVLHQECQIETKKVTFAELPPAMQAEYTSRAEGNQIVQLGVRDAVRLLQHKCPASACAQLLCGDPGQRLLHLLSARNDSVLAHGFTPVQSSVYDELRGLIAELARATWPQRFDNACNMTLFPSFSS